MIQVLAIACLFLLTLWMGMGLMNAADANQPKKYLWAMAWIWSCAMTLAVDLILGTDMIDWGS